MPYHRRQPMNDLDLRQGRPKVRLLPQRIDYDYQAVKTMGRTDDVGCISPALFAELAAMRPNITRIDARRSCETL